MMISPYSYIFEHENDTFEQLIQERDQLIDEVRRLEKMVFSEDRSDEEWGLCPRPDVQYQVNLEYLSELCSFISRKYYNEKERTYNDENS